MWAARSDTPLNMEIMPVTFHQTDFEFVQLVGLKGHCRATRRLHLDPWDIELVVVCSCLL